MAKQTYTSTALNLVLNVNESVKITTINRNGLETFV